MTDPLHQHIDELVAEEHRLRGDASSHTDDDRARLAHLETQLDQAWDLLRRRDAARALGQPESAVDQRPAEEVEGYLQ